MQSVRRLDTFTDVNIMPASVYKLVFCDPDLKKLAPSRLEIWIYTTNTVKLVGFCTLDWCIQVPSIYKKRHSMLQATIEVFCCLVQPYLHLA